jgi:hydroxypyruvate isomerase
MKRKDFLSNTALASAGLLFKMEDHAVHTTQTPDSSNTWKMRFAPHIGLNRPDDYMFPELAGKNPIDQIKFLGEMGFSGIEDNFLQWRPVEMQKKIGDELVKNRMEMGCFVSTKVYDRPSFVLNTSAERERLIAELKAAIEAAKRVNGKWLTTLSSLTSAKQPFNIQTANMIENLKYMSEYAEKSGVVLLVEAINAYDYPGTFVTHVPHAYEIVKAVNNPGVRLMFDVFHAQIMDGDLIKMIDRTWDQISFIQIADNPGRVEPGVGEINYANVLGHIKAKGYNGLVEFEHTYSRPGKTGEQAVIASWKKLNAQLG